MGEATFLVGLVAAVAAVIAIIYGEINRRQQNRHHKEQRALAHEQLQLAREQAEMRPILKVVCQVKRHHRFREDGSLEVRVSNNGKVAAHNVRGWIRFHKDSFGAPRPLPRTILFQSGAIFDHSAEPDENG